MLILRQEASWGCFSSFWFQFCMIIQNNLQMKRFPFLQVVVLAVLLVTVASCSVPMGTSGEYYEDAPARGNVYYGDPYYGNTNTIIVERDPYTGRYYQVSPRGYGSVYGAPAY